MTREVMEQALEALKWVRKGPASGDYAETISTVIRAINTIEAELAQPMPPRTDLDQVISDLYVAAYNEPRGFPTREAIGNALRYLQAEKQQWISFSEEELVELLPYYGDDIEYCLYRGLIRLAEKRLKEKNK